MPPPAAPVITLIATTAMSAQIGWDNNAVFPALLRIQRCRGAGCTSWVTRSSGEGVFDAIAKTLAERRIPGETYRYRAFIEDGVNGNSDFSNILEFTMPTGLTGLVRVGGAVGITTSFEVGSSGRAFISIYAGGLTLDGGIINLFLNDPFGGFECDGSTPLDSSYMDASGNIVTGPSGGSGLVGMEFFIDRPDGERVQHCPGALNQKLELRFRLGSSDYLTRQHLSDGYYEARVNGTVVLRAEGLPLGIEGVTGWRALRISPQGRYAGPGSPTITPTPFTQGGLIELYVNSTDVYGAGYGGPDPRFNRWEKYAELTDDDLWSDLGDNDWIRMSDLGTIVGTGAAGPSTVPRKVGDKVMGIIAMMATQFEEDEPSTGPSGPSHPPEEGNGTPCISKKPCEPPGGSGPSGPPPSEGGQFLCAGGGDVPFYPTVVQPSMAGVREPRTWARIDFLRDIGV